MLQNIGTRIGPPAQHPVGVSLMHRPQLAAGGALTRQPALGAHAAPGHNLGRPKLRNPFRKR